MEILIKVIQFFMSLTLLVAVHEFGHFIVARLFKIRVEKFYIFFDWGFSLFKCKRGDTEYGLGWVPLGGYCKIAGMIDESMDKEQMARPPQPWEYRAKPAWQRFFVLIAGVAMNVLLAFMIYCGIAYTWGKSYLSNDSLTYGIAFNEDGEKLGFRDGDHIVSINGKKVDNYAVILNEIIFAEQDSRHVEVLRDGELVAFDMNYDVLNDVRGAKRIDGLCQPLMPFIVDSTVAATAREAGLLRGDRIVALNGTPMLHYGDYGQALTELAGQTATLTVQRDTTTLQLAVPVNAEGKIGVMLRPWQPEITTIKYGFWESIPAGAQMAKQTMLSYVRQLKMIFKPETQLYKSVGGFISIGNIFPGMWDWQSFWFMTAFLSVALAVMNIIPIPGLDGGHTLFTLWEMITRRKPSDRFLEIAQYIGMGLILMLLLFANGNDIIQLFK